MVIRKWNWLNLSEEFTFQGRSNSCDPAWALCRSRGSGRAEVCVASPRSDRPLVGQAASCGATLAETLDGPSLDSSATRHRALTQRQEGNSRETKSKRERRKSQRVINRGRRSNIIIVKRAGKGGERWMKSLCRDKEQMKKTNIPSSMYSPSSKLSGDIFSDGNIQGSQALDQAE